MATGVVEFCAPEEPKPNNVQPHSSSWWRTTSAEKLQRSESLMLHTIKYRQGSVAGLNTITTVGTDWEGVAPGKEVMVLVHGFGGGLACWAQNWEFLSSYFVLYAVDLPGFGRSVRPNVSVDTPKEAMDFFCEYLDRWFDEVKISVPVILVGHSFGAYVAAHYAMRCGPSRVRVLGLVDPWGVNKAEPSEDKKLPLKLRLALMVLKKVNPLAPLRAAGPVGPLLFRVIRPDFAHRWRGFLQNTGTFYDYTFHCNAQLPPIGESLFKVCYHRHVIAKTPLEDTLPYSLSKEVPIVVLYGSDTWMNAERGTAMALKMADMGFRVKVDTVMKAGHQVFTDNPPEFNSKLLSSVTEMLAANDIMKT
uniref:AB hydrolase-1 domain-containing protein n=1 Tax=Trypanosoma congolense (strain IL3000) TaxID=1068625 RepID=G0URI0_TRYCI|nr:conserved hypothetical protein [Trypanosoma congolense IL3000]